MGKQYTTAPILVNSNGDPIPQYLDITDKTDSPQGTFKPLTNETIQKVQLTGSNVGYRERVVVVDSLAIADTSSYYFFINEELSRRTLRMTLEIYNTLDQPVRVALLSNARLSNVDIIRDHEGKEYEIEVPGNQDFKPYLFTGKDFPILEYPIIANLGLIRFRVRCPIAPTKGFVNLVANLFFV